MTTALQAKTFHRVIIDTDTAGDDAMAIALMARAPNIKIEGITTLAGNVPIEQTLQNALMTIEMAGVADIPVYKGSDSTLDGIKRQCFSVFGHDGMGDQELIHPKGKAQEQIAVDFILETVKKYPDEIEILAIGPATNIAAAILKDPLTMKRVKRIWSMGTTGFGPGNATPVAEFNVYQDAHAYQVMMQSGIAVTIIGLDICELDDLVYSPEDVQTLSNSSALGNFLARSWSKLHEFKKQHQGTENVDICDAVAAATLIWDDFVQDSKLCSSYVCTEENPTYGQVIFYRKDFTYDSMPKTEHFDKTVITAVSTKRFKPQALKLLSEEFK